MSKNKIPSVVCRLLNTAVVMASSFGFMLPAYSGGYEKTVLWSGKEAGVAGAGVSISEGAESLFFNPAGLSTKRAKKFEATIQASPTFVKTSGPITADNTVTDGQTKFLPIAAALAQYQVNEKWGVGLGAYVAGGAASFYDDLNLSNFSVPGGTTNYNFPGFSPDVESRLRIMEYALGTGYEVLPGLKIGGSWRIVHVTAKLQTAAAVGAGANAVFSSVVLDNLSQWRFNGYRFGINYTQPVEKPMYGVGITVRTPVKFNLKGTSSMTYGSAVTGTVGSGTGGDVWAGNEFPLQIQAGGFFRLSSLEHFRFLGEYSFTQYSNVDRISLTGSNFTPTTAGLNGTEQAIISGLSPLSVYNIQQDWRNLHIMRIGTEWDGLGDSQIVRAGYALTGKITPNQWVRPTFVAPGLGHTFTGGYGRNITLAGNLVEVNGALEYSFAKGKTSSETAALATNSSGRQVTRPGDYSAMAYAAHLGATYRF